MEGGALSSASYASGRMNLENESSHDPSRHGSGKSSMMTVLLGDGSPASDMKAVVPALDQDQEGREAFRCAAGMYPRGTERTVLLLSLPYLHILPGVLVAEPLFL